MELERKYHARTDHAPTLERLGFARKGGKHQVDTYYIVNKTVDGGAAYLRVREDRITGAASLDYHIARSDEVTEEIETAVDCAQNAMRILESLGHDIVCVVDKRRETYAKDGVTAVLDTVPALGRFIEVEIEGAPTPENLQKLDAACATLGLAPEDRVAGKGYPDLLLETCR